MTNFLAGYRILAVAKVAFQEAVRRRIFLSLWMFLIVLVVSAFSLPVIQQEARFDLVLFVSVTATLVFSSLIAVFIASMGLPEEIRDRRIMTLLSKPLHRYELLLGKILGLTAVMALLLTGMLIITTLSLRVATGTTETNGLPPARNVILPSTVEIKQPQAILDLAAKTGRYWIRQSGDELGIKYFFTGLQPQHYGPTIATELFYITQQQNHWNNQMVDQHLLLTLSGNETQTVLHPLQDKRGSTLFEIPTSLIRDDGSLEILVQRNPNSEMIGIRSVTQVHQLQGIKLYAETVPQILNLAKAFAMILLENLFLITLCVCASTFVSGSVAVVLGMSLLIGGSILDYVKESLSFSRDQVQLEQERQTSRHPETDGHEGHKHGADNPFDRMVYNEEFLSLVQQLTIIFPNFNRFNPLPWLKPRYSIGPDYLWMAFVYMGQYALIFFVIGTLIFRRVQIL